MGEKVIRVGSHSETAVGVEGAASGDILPLLSSVPGSGRMRLLALVYIVLALANVGNTFAGANQRDPDIQGPIHKDEGNPRAWGVRRPAPLVSPFLAPRR